VRVAGVVPGKRISVNKVTEKSFFIENTGDETKEFFLEIVSGPSLDMNPPRYSQWGPESAVFKISPRKTRIKPGGKKKFKMKLRLPDEPEFYGKKFQYLLRVTPEGIGIGKRNIQNLIDKLREPFALGFDDSREFGKAA